MKKSFIGFLAILTIFNACKPAGKSQSKVSKEPSIISLGNQEIPTAEFTYVYNKNNSNSDDAYSEKSIREYLELYVNFRLKVKEAETLGLDTTAAFKKELEGYRRQLAQPYLTEKGVTEQLTKEAYDRMKEEIRASHILITVSPDADPKDTLAAFTKIAEIRDKALKGEDFGKLAKEFSQDPSAKTNNGDLGYFTALQMVYPFEDAAYKTPVGQISNPVRTKFGYHIIKVRDRRKSQGQVRVAHIMVRATTGLPESDSIAAKQKIDEIYSRAIKGEDWNQLASQFSDDVNSKSKGGELQWFSTGKMIPSFEEASFKLVKQGDISAPIQTPYGWHVIKLLEKKELESFQELESSLKSKVSKDSRSELNKSMLIARLKRENTFTENQKTLDLAISKADSTLLSGSWNFTADPKNNPVLFTINKENTNLNDFLSYVKEKQRFRKNISPAQYMRVMYKDFHEDKLISYEEAHLHEKYIDYKMLVKEYRDGILLFQLMDEKVWSKAIEDTAGLKAFFNGNREKYKWKDRAEAVIYSVSDKETLELLKTDINKGSFQVRDFKLDPIQFAVGKAELPESSKKDLDKLAFQMIKDKALSAIVESSADAKENLNISTQRANVVADYLKSKGVDSTRIIVKDLGRAPAKKTEAERVADRKTSIKLFSTSKKVLESNYNQNAPLTLQVSEGMFQKGENEILNKVEWKAGTYTFEKDGRVYFVKINKTEEPRQKTFEESRGMAISDYQSYLEQEWIKDLKKKYPVTVNDAEVQKLIKK
ncbi:MAG: peptidylprolyl isomerase [Cytophagaceae bacterium]